MVDLIKFRKGNKANLPNLRLGEPGVALDEGRLYIGGIDGNIQIPNMNDVNEKADKTEVQSLQNNKADKSTVQALEANKADKVEVTRVREDLLNQSPVSHKPKRKPLMTIIDDDCSPQLYSVIYPILQSKNVKITAAAITNRIETGNGASINKTQYNELLNSGLVEFISHTSNHIDLPSVSLSQAEQELATSREWLINNGGNPDYLAYPFGGNNAEVRALTRKYYKGAFGVSGGVNYPPLKTYLINRKDFVTAGNNALIDEAVANNGWVVFMTHAGYQDFNATSFSNLIDYARSKGIDIVTVGEAMKYYGNLLDIGDTVDPENWEYSVIDADGHAYGRLNSVIHMTANSAGITGTSPITAYPKNAILRVRLTYSQASSLGFPTAGVLETERWAGADSFSTQTLHVYQSTQKKFRYWQESGGWSAWVDI